MIGRSGVAFECGDCIPFHLPVDDSLPGAGMTGGDNDGGGDVAALDPTTPTMTVPAYDPGSSAPMAGGPGYDLDNSAPTAGGAEGQPVTASIGDAGGQGLGSDNQTPYQPGVSAAIGPDNLNNPSTDVTVTAPRVYTPSAINYSTDPMAQSLIGLAGIASVGIGGPEEEGVNLAIQLHHAFPMYLGGAAKQELVALPAALHTAYHVTLDAALPRRLGANFYSNLGPRALGEVYDTFAAVTQKFNAEFGTNLYNAAVRNGFPGAVR